MALYPRMIGRALEGDVERDFEPQLARACEERREIIERSELRMQ